MPPPSKREEMCRFRKRWIPAFAGMTYGRAGMTYKWAGMTIKIRRVMRGTGLMNQAPTLEKIKYKKQTGSINRTHTVKRGMSLYFMDMLSVLW